MADLVSRYLDPQSYVVVNGAVAETTALLNHRWGHIFFTGGGKIGKIIASIAAQNLTPVTLELGGKSPVVIDDNCDLELAAKRTLFGKSQNSGQVRSSSPKPPGYSVPDSSHVFQLCVSPDHVYVPRRVVGAFKEAVKKAYATFFPDSALHPDAQWGKIVNPSHHSRLKGILERTQGEILVGGQMEGDRRIAPTVVAGVKPNDSLMEEYVTLHSRVCKLLITCDPAEKFSGPCCPSLKWRMWTKLFVSFPISM